MNVNVKDYAERLIKDTRDRYIQDLEAMWPEQLALRPGGAARSAYDMTYEVVFINHRFVKRIKREEPEPFVFGTWLEAPEEFRDKSRAIDAFRESFELILAELEPIPVERYDEEISMSQGTMSIFEMATFIARHAGYHDAQLNYIQALQGDTEVHWA
jgi:hypothetical protein